MAKTVKKRVREWREKKAREGGRSFSAWLEPETAQMLDDLRNYYGETSSPLVARAIRALFEVTCNTTETAPAAPAKELTASVTCNHEKTIAPGDTAKKQVRRAKEVPQKLEADLLLQKLQDKLARGVPFRELKKPLLLEWIKAMQKQNASFEVIAEKLNEARIPTLTGKGRWEKGMIPTILILSFR